MSDFSPKTEKQIEEEKLFAPGVYDFDCISATKWIGQESGKESLKVKLCVYVGDRKYFLDQFLSASEKMQFMLRHFCDSLGILDAYESGSFQRIAEAAPGLSGKAKFYIAEDKKGQFPDKNQVRDFIKKADYNKYAMGSANVASELPRAKKSEPETPFDDDVIPY